jgi:hypothetical protein
MGLFRYEYLLINVTASEVAQAVMLPVCIQEVLGLIPSQNTDYPD